MRRFRNQHNVGRKPTQFGGIFTRRQPERRPTTVATNLTFEVLEPRLQMAVVINEFLAANSDGLQDEDLDRPDWIELKNTDASPVNVGGWYLTDDMADLDKWQIPAGTNIAAGGYLKIFASGKDRAISGQELHTDFSLEKNGESLALVMPNGTTIADSFDPYPEQEDDISYGRGATSAISETLIGDNAPVKVRVPSSSADDFTWYTTGFDDSSGWTSGISGVGFDNNGGTSFLPYVGTNVETAMLGITPSAYIRMPFNVTNPSELTTLTLRMRYDDGFFVYLNGNEIVPARRNAPLTALNNYLGAASQGHPDVSGTLYEDIDLTSFRDKLLPGPNVLGIHALNSSAASGDLLIDPLLIAERSSQTVIGYMVTPTPNATNSLGTLGFVDDTKFSFDRGFYNDPFNVAITTTTPGAEIRYTLDGSTPTASHGTVYNPLSPPQITTTTNLRAAAFKSDYTPSNVDTQTYIFLEDVIQQNGQGLPAVTNWGWAGPDWAMDPDVVNHPDYASTIMDDLKSVPTMSLVMPWDHWFGPPAIGIYPTETEVEQAVSVEYFTADGTEEFQIDAGIEIQGGTSDDRWKIDKLSMRVKFQQQYGPGKLDSDFLNHPVIDDDAAIEFDTLILDAQINYTWPYGGTSGAVDQRARAKFIQDQYVADLQNLAGGNAPHGRVVHLYINGLYWGIYMVHERPDDSFNQAYLGGNRDDWDVIKLTDNSLGLQEVSGGSTAVPNYQAMLSVALNPTPNYAAVEQELDIDGLLDYMIINYYVGNDDWAHHNWYASFNRVDPNGKWRFHSWDAEHVLKNLFYNAIQTNVGSQTPETIHLNLMNNSNEYKLRFMDRVQRLMRDEGLLTPQSSADIYTARKVEVDRAIVGESARWGDSHTTNSEPPGAGNAYTRNDHWIPTYNDLIDNYFPLRTNVVLDQFVSRGWSASLLAPLMSQYGGTVNILSQVSLSKPGGSPGAAQIWYTLDGTDPRNRTTNLPSASAILYNGTPISFADGIGKHVQARIYLDGAGSSISEWSPVVDKTFLMEAPFPVRITELNYHPADDADTEFFELTNTGSETINLASVEITQFATNPFEFGNVNLAAGERIIVARNPAAFQALYGPGHNVLSTGYGDANLSNSGELIVLLGPLGETLQSFTYSDSGDWPSTPDGDGPSLEIIDPLGDPTSPANWRASAYVGGSPGASGVMGDYDGNGVVQDADYTVWKSKFGSTVAVGTSADGNRDGNIDLADYVMWRKAMNTPAASAVVATTNAVVNRAASSVVDSIAAPVVAESKTPPISRPTLPAVDDVFTQFDSTRHAFRPVLARTPASTSGSDDLLLASLAGRAAPNVADHADIGADRPQGDESPVDRLLADWSGIDDALELN